MTSPRRWRRGLCALFAAAALAGRRAPRCRRVPRSAPRKTTRRSPCRSRPHWVYILEPVFPYLVSSKVWILDGDTLEFVGMASAGYTANLVLSHDKSAFYVAETYWDRGARAATAPTW